MGQAIGKLYDDLFGNSMIRVIFFILEVDKFVWNYKNYLCFWLSYESVCFESSSYLTVYIYMDGVLIHLVNTLS